MFVKELRLLAPTEEAYDKFRQDLKSVFYRWEAITPGLQTTTGSKSADDDSDSARSSRDDLVSDFFKSILYFFGPRVRTVAPDFWDLYKLLEGGLGVLYPGHRVDSYDISRVSRLMLRMHITSLSSPDRKLSASYTMG